MNEKSKKILLRLYQIFLEPSALKIGLIISLLFTSFLYRHYQLPKGSVDLIGDLERKLYDVRFKMRGPKKTSGKVGVLAADDASIEYFGRWPFNRDIYEKSFENLKKRGVKWIGFDVFFSEPSRRLMGESQDDIHNYILNISKNGATNEQIKKFLAELSQTSPADRSFGKAISDFGNIVQGYYFVDSADKVKGTDYDWLTSFERLKNSTLDFTDFPGKMKLYDYESIKSFGAVTNTYEVAGQSQYVGFANNELDPDGIMRKVLLVRSVVPMDAYGKEQGEPILVPSLGLSLAANYYESVPVVHFDTSGIESIELMPLNSEKSQIKLPIFYDGEGRMLLKHYSAFHYLPIVSLKDSYLNNLPEKLPEILIYGGTGTGTNDKRPSPFDENFDGVGHHVSVVENILNADFMDRKLTYPFIELALLIISGLIFSLILKYTSALKSFLFLLAVCFSYYLIDYFYLFGKGKWFYMGTFYLQSVGIYFGVIIYKYFTEEREKKKIKGAFQHYLNPAVIDQLMQNPDQLSLGGQKKRLTVFFSDVRGFTTISESLSPEKLTALLNEYFTPMTNIILNTGGLLDKYIGDAIMAVWGAPLPVEDHADRALISSLKMFDELDILQKKWANEGLPFLDIGIGLNTGDMVVGNMGSDTRFDYTVLGDAVNLGARLEGINKNYGTRLICSEFTRQSLKNPQDFVLRELDKIQVKGKNEPVTIFEVMRFTQNERANAVTVSKLFGEGLELYRAKKWNDAEEAFRKILKIYPEDGPSLEFIDRCTYLREHPVDEKWDGVWVFKTK